MTTLQQTAEEAASNSRKLATLKGLDLVNDTTTPIPTAVATYYSSNLANGSGPDGTYLTTDFFGSSAGIPYNDDLTTVTNTITAQLSADTLTALNIIYSQMKSVVTSAYGTPPTITIPSGPASGTYATYNLALQALITAADAAIGTAITAMGTATTTLNSAWTEMTTHSANEVAVQIKAGIDYATLTAGAQLPISAFIPALTVYGQDRQEGMAFDFLTSIANTANQYGQAMVGALLEGGNKAGIDAIGLKADNDIPQLPNAVPPTVSINQYEYTPNQARAQIQP